MPLEHNAFEMAAIAEQCNEYTSCYQESKLPDLMGATKTTCDNCAHWDNGYCDIFLREKYGSFTGELSGEVEED